MLSIDWPDKPRRACLFCTKFVVDDGNVCEDHLVRQETH